MPVMRALRGLLAVAMVVVGSLHFANPEPFVRIVPDFLGGPLFLVYLSGSFEIGLGLLLLSEATRRWASYGLIALFVAVFPANLNMALNNIQLDPADPLPTWALYARLPMQLVFIAWAYAVGRPDPKQ